MSSWTIEGVRERVAEDRLEPGLRVLRLWEEAHDGHRLLFAEFDDERNPEQRSLHFWWDVDDPFWGLGAQTDDEVTGDLEFWLWEAFLTSNPDDCRKDADGTPWTGPSWPFELPPGREPAPFPDRVLRRARVDGRRVGGRLGWWLRVNVGRLFGVRHHVTLTPVDDEDVADGHRHEP